MKNEKESRKLGIEELERRAAPVVIVDADQPEPTEPTTGGDELPAGGGDGGDVMPDQPGGSDLHRKEIWKRTYEELP